MNWKKIKKLSSIRWLFLIAQVFSMALGQVTLFYIFFGLWIPLIILDHIAYYKLTKSTWRAFASAGLWLGFALGMLFL